MRRVIDDAQEEERTTRTAWRLVLRSRRRAVHWSDPATSESRAPPPQHGVRKAQQPGERTVPAQL